MKNEDLSAKQRIIADPAVLIIGASMKLTASLAQQDPCTQMHDTAPILYSDRVYAG
jgi:hypothetical protein